ncbi:hypothetical protein ACWKW4_13810 [Hydrogenophaga borbori]|uniref:hypothetical protein n=1 Tax=Hydrogenophaga borbori TaxID=2294117 RepID=UPI00301D451B
MFVTSDAFVQFLHPSAVAPRQQYWRMVTLTLERHWYLVVYNVIYQGRKVSQTSLVAWDATLLDMLAEIPAEDLMGVARLDWRAGDRASWSLRWVETLWKSSNTEAQAIGPLVFTLNADSQARNVQLIPVSGCPERQLLFHSRAASKTDS